MARNRNLLYRLVDLMLRRLLRLTSASSKRAERLALWWGYNFRPAPAIVTSRSGAKIEVDPTDHLQLLIYYTGQFEGHCLPYLRGCVRQGGVMIDVGANIGFYTLEAAMAVGATGRVISIEAAPPHLEKLHRNVKLNNMKNVSIVGTAVGDSPAEAFLTLPQGENLGMYTLGAAKGDEQHLVTIRTLDSILIESGIDSVDLIKMDIEGSEFRALLGAQQALKKFRPSLLVELNESALVRCGSSSQEIKSLLGNAGYLGWLIDTTGTRHLTMGQVSHGCDECLFIHRDKSSLIRDLKLEQ